MFCDLEVSGEMLLSFVCVRWYVGYFGSVYILGLKVCVFHLGLDFLHSCFVTKAVRPGFKFRLSLLFLFFFLVQSQITVRTLQRMRQVP